MSGWGGNVYVISYRRLLLFIHNQFSLFHRPYIKVTFVLMKFQFSGHDSFICKHFWLKKGFDFLMKRERTFNDDLAVVDLGVGKNMVTAISYWLKAYGICNQSNEITALGLNLFNDKTGYDPYLENLGSIWLLHYSLIKSEKASIYHLFFNEFKRDKFQFTREQLLNFLLRKLEGNQQNNVNANTINTDISVFIRNYLKSGFRHRKIDIEDEFSNLFVDLEMMESYQSENAEEKMVEWYKVENDIRVDLPSEVVLFTILDNDGYGNSISFKELLVGVNSPGAVFALSDEGLYNKIEQIQAMHPDITYTESAGVRELQFKSKPDKWKILHEYYNN